MKLATRFCYCSPLLKGLTFAVLSMMSLARPVNATPPPMGLAPVVDPAEGMGIDGDLFARQPTLVSGDWIVNTNLPGTGGSVLAPDGTPLSPVTTFHFIDPFNDSSSDFIFTGGSKWAHDPGTWDWTTGKPSSKTDINNVLLHLASDTEGHTWVMISADRASTSGDSYIDFELLQNPLLRTNDGAFSSMGPHGGRTMGDMVLSLAFTGGGKTADFLAWRWEPDGTGGYHYVDVTSVLPAGRVFVALNTTVIPVPYPAFGEMEYQPNAFAEAAIDLTALLGGFDPCESFGFESIMVKTKSSASYSAGIEDFIDPIGYKLQIGPAAEAGVDQTRCADVEGTTFQLNGTASAGVTSVASIQWTVVSGIATIDAPTSLVSTARVSSDSATLRLEVLQANGCTDFDEIVLTTVQPPSLAITGPALLCPDSSADFNAPPAMDSYEWSISGNASILGATDQETVSVVAGAACGESFDLTLAVSSGVCTVAIATEVMVDDSNPPVLIIPDNLVLECPADTRTGATGSASAQDDCSTPIVTFSDAITYGCGDSKSIARTWSAVDECGNVASAVQTITVQDISAPTLSIPPNLTLECPASTAAAATGVASAMDNCGNPTVTFSDVVTYGCGDSRTVARTWSAVDECGNVASAVQTITVQDTSAPTLSVPPSLTLECPASTDTAATGIASAMDNCGNPTVTFSDVVTFGCGDSRTVARTWSAVDECGNVASAVQTITVQDTIVPRISIPPDLTLECPASTDTATTGVGSAQDNCGSPTVTFSDAITYGCGDSRSIARTWSAVDECGNVASAVQTITVQDTIVPRLSIPPDLTLECPASTDTAATGVGSAQDNCGSPTVTFSDVVTFGCGDSRTIARTWSAVDECGNAASAIQTITVQDTSAPTLSVPPNLTLECPATTDTAATGIASAQDNCGNPTVTFSDVVTFGCGDSRTVARTWSAVDECGNAASAVQTITVQDTTTPSIDCPPFVTVEFGESTKPDQTGWALGSDACGETEIRYTDQVTELCGGSRIIERTWMALDECGNTSSCSQRITVQDTTPPVILLPPDVTLECPADTGTHATGVATGSDASGLVTISHTDVVTEGECGGTMTIARTWTATDVCGNITSEIQNILVQDTTPPTIMCPDITVQCVGDVPAVYASLIAFRAGGGMATDSCAVTVTLSLASDSGLVGSCPATITRVYRATDDCGNVAECTQTITVDDTIAPTISCPGSVVLECGDSLDPSILGNATVIDNCATNVLITYSDAEVPSEYTIKWYAADPVLNSGPYAPTYLKLSPNSLTCPSTAELTGRAIDPLRNAVAYSSPSGQLDALTSLGGEPMALGQVVPFEAVIEVSGGPGPERGTIEFTSSWSTHTTSNDRFGYDTNYMVYCAFVDPADPGTVDPNYNARVESFSSALVDAGTIDEQIQGTFRISGLESGDRVIVEIWVVLLSTRPDKIGGTIASDLVSAEKGLNPPEPITVGTQTVSIGNLSKITSLPTQQEQPPLPESPLPPQPPALPGATVSVIDRTWAATDNCGNRSTCIQRITVRDTTPPTFVETTGQVVDPEEVWTMETPLATDGCGDVVVQIYSIETNMTASGSQMITYIWEAIDASGNRALTDQDIEVLPVTLPDPGLSIARNGEWLSVSWPRDPEGWWLESTPSLTEPSWKPVALSPLQTDDRYVIQVDPTGPSQWFRLASGEPPITLSPSSAGMLTLTWPSLATGYAIEHCEDLASGIWTVQLITPQTTNGLHRVEFAPTGESGFFRLVKPEP